MRVIRRFRYINHYRDRHGRQRYYFRRGRGPQIPLPGKPGSPEFDAAYSEALRQPREREIGVDRSPAGSVSAVIAAYFRHNSFTSLRKSTQQSRRAVLEKFRGAHGDKPIATVRSEHLEAILGELKPFAQHNWLKTLRGLMKFCVAAGMRKADPTLGIERAKAEAGSIHTWTETEIAQYLATHAKGTRAYCAIVLLLYTGQRGSDIVRMSPTAIQGDRIFVKQQKTGTEVLIPIHSVLCELIEALRRPGVIELKPATWLQKDRGGAYDRPAFSNQFRVWCDQAGLKHCSAHGLRKAMCRRLAEAGCSAMEIMAITGHKTLSECERYVREAEQVRLADGAMRAIAGL